MLNTNKAVALASLLGSLALAGTATQAHAEDAEPKCQVTDDGIHCSQKIDRRHVSDDGKVVIKQSWDCTSYSRTVDMAGVPQESAEQSAPACSNQNDISR